MFYLCQYQSCALSHYFNTNIEKKTGNPTTFVPIRVVKVAEIIAGDYFLNRYFLPEVGLMLIKPRLKKRVGI